ncbi:hypothetical protein HYW46_01875 [Candidatus Daviesbacteria bacterium]|nr:hypothetical protein [Candidatus Daviesbacteria bacterium]
MEFEDHDNLQNLVRYKFDKLPEQGFDLSMLHNIDTYNLVRNENRIPFYQRLRSLLPENFSVYYPGSGADPVPAIVFESRIIYGSLQESDYFGFLRGTAVCTGLCYSEVIKKYGPFGNLKMIYADLFNPPFKDKQFDLVIVDSPLQMLEKKG